MPSKKKKYNARFPPARIKKIMQSDEEVGKVAQAVPVIISRALELFVESLLKKAETVTQGRNAKTLTPSHLKQCIMAESRFDFLKDLVSAVPDVQGEEDLAETPTPRSVTSNQGFVYPTAATASPSSRNSPSAAATGSSSEQQQQLLQGLPPYAHLAGPRSGISISSSSSIALSNSQQDYTTTASYPSPPPAHSSNNVSLMNPGFILQSMQGSSSSSSWYGSLPPGSEAQ